MNLPGPPYWISPHLADESCLVGVGGDLDPDTLLAAYRAGVFPWFGEDDSILWFSPDPRGVIPLLHGFILPFVKRVEAASTTTGHGRA